MKKYINWKNKKKIQYIRLFVYTRRTMRKYLLRYKKIKIKYFWRKRLGRIYPKYYNCRIALLAFLKFKKYGKRYKKEPHSKAAYASWLKFYTNCHKNWISIVRVVKLRNRAPMFNGLWPRWKLKLTGATLYDVDNLKVFKLFKRKKWLKLRKRWIWHRLIKWSVKVKFLSNLKKYFAYNIAVRKYFNYNIDNDYASHGKILLQKAPHFLVQRKIVPIIKQAIKLCQWRKVNVNGMLATPLTRIKQFDIVSFNILKEDLRKKYNKYRLRKKRRGSKFRLEKGLIYNKKLKAYIFYKNLDFFTKKTPINYLYYYYYHRNLLQGCRMQ